MNQNEIKQDSLKAWLLAARPKTLTGAAVPVIIGLALAWVDAQEYIADVFKWPAALLCLAFALLMQIDANFINDFFDYTRGNDDIDRRLGPLRACTQGWVKIDSMKRAIALTTCVALYTTHLSYIGMGDLLVVVFFGIVPVCITYYIQLHTCTWQVFIASVACGLVIDGLLIINNYRDRDNDREDGKKTLVVEIGAEAAEWLYLSLGVIAVLAGIVFWLNGHILAFLLPFFYLLLHVLTWQKMRHINHGRELNVCLGETARNMLVYGLCVAIGVLLL